ncbi:hypothetical protein NLG97_g8755 [Lecanicillium saksenae]|uniref:Uncharacterized protein n=1 Tax=Lecanicillium saksenae TaxID=468837 RepID=A0ACC1QIK0_9HYPO|nr:hypothetical protein NLG97_g8755 [Lecanicillium saksenae]
MPKKWVNKRLLLFPATPRQPTTTPLSSIENAAATATTMPLAPGDSIDINRLSRHEKRAVMKIANELIKEEFRTKFAAQLRLHGGYASDTAVEQAFSPALINYVLTCRYPDSDEVLERWDAKATTLLLDWPDLSTTTAIARTPLRFGPRLNKLIWIGFKVLLPHSILQLPKLLLSSLGKFPSNHHKLIRGLTIKDPAQASPTSAHYRPRSTSISRPRQLYLQQLQSGVKYDRKFGGRRTQVPTRPPPQSPATPQAPSTIPSPNRLDILPHKTCRELPHDFLAGQHPSTLPATAQAQPDPRRTPFRTVRVPGLSYAKSKQLREAGAMEVAKLYMLNSEALLFVRQLTGSASSVAAGAKVYTQVVKELGRRWVSTPPNPSIREAYVVPVAIKLQGWHSIQAEHALSIARNIVRLGLDYEALHTESGIDRDMGFAINMD